MKCRFKKGADGITIRDASGCLRLELTKIFRAMARPSTDSNARAIVSALHLFWMEARRRGLNFSASSDQVRAIVEYLLVHHYNTEITGVLGIRRKVHAVRNVNSVRAFLSGLIKGFELLEKHGERSGDNPIRPYRAAWGDLGRHQYVARYGGLMFPETLLGCYQVTGTRPIPPEVADGTVLPDAVRTAFERVNANLGELAYLETLISTGVRNSEVGSATFGSFQHGFGDTLKVRNKGRGSEASKSVQWSPAAREAYQKYFLQQRLQHDPLRVRFLAWAGKRTITIDLYLKFLRAKRIDLTTVPLFLTRAGEEYTGDTFRHEIWRRAKLVSTIKASPHHLRHAYVNAQLGAIWNEWGDKPHLYIQQLIKFVKKMGWSHWSALVPYDFEQLATTALREHFRSGGSEKAPVQHGTAGQEMMERIHDDTIHARPRPEPTRVSA